MAVQQPILDPRGLSLDNPIADLEQIRAHVPQRFEFEMLHGILHFDQEQGIGAAYKKIGAEEFWVRGHIPGRPLFPGVLMIETAAQLCCYVFCRSQQDGRFFAFGGVDQVRFRGTVLPGDQLIIMVKSKRMRSNLGQFNSQAYVDNKLVYDGIITGMILADDR